MSGDRSAFCQALLDRFDGCYESPGGEVWVRYADALEAVDLADRMGIRLLGMEGFLVDGTDVFPAMSRIADFGDADAATAQTTARSLLTGTWAEPPHDVHSDAKGEYLIDLAVAG
jgi:hypothetical protein